MIQEVIKPASLEEAVKLKKQGMSFLSGGTLVNWAPAEIKAEKVVLLENLLSDGIYEKEGKVEIGAFCTLQSIVDTAIVPQALRVAAGFIPSRNIRNMATIGGNIAANRPDSYVIPALLALSARVQTLEEGEMSVDTYISEGKSSLITEVIIPEQEGVCVIDRSVRSSASYPSVTAAVYYSGSECVVAVGCIADRVIRLKQIEDDITSGKLDTEDEIFNAVYNSIDPEDDIKETGTYKKYIASTIIARQVQLCRKGEV